MPTTTPGSTSLNIAASPAAVYDLISDVSRMGERSPECYHAQWLDGVSSATVGARFRGSTGSDRSDGRRPAT